MSSPSALPEGGKPLEAFLKGGNPPSLGVDAGSSGVADRFSGGKCDAGGVAGAWLPAFMVAPPNSFWSGSSTAKSITTTLGKLQDQGERAWMQTPKTEHQSL